MKMPGGHSVGIGVVALVRVGPGPSRAQRHRVQTRTGSGGERPRGRVVRLGFSFRIAPTTLVGRKLTGGTVSLLMWGDKRLDSLGVGDNELSRVGRDPAEWGLLRADVWREVNAKEEFQPCVRFMAYCME